MSHDSKFYLDLYIHYLLSSVLFPVIFSHSKVLLSLQIINVATLSRSEKSFNFSDFTNITS